MVRSPDGPLETHQNNPSNRCSKSTVISVQKPAAELSQNLFFLQTSVSCELESNITFYHLQSIPILSSPTPKAHLTSIVRDALAAQKGAVPPAMPEPVVKIPAGAVRGGGIKER